jgi:hypothetical protein
VSNYKNPTLSPESKSFYEGKNSLLSDYTRFNIQVDKVISGSASAVIAATWDNSTFSLPETMPDGPYVIALRRPQSPVPPLRGPSATIFPNQEPDLLTVLQAPCAQPFLFEANSAEAQAVLKILEVAPR